MRQRLTKIQSTHTNLRTNEIVGEALAALTVGESFTFTAEALDPAVKAAGGARYIITTPVKVIERLSPTKVRFETKNSSYELETLDNAN